MWTKALIASAGIALATSLGLYMFFKIHQELDIAPSYAWGLGAIIFLLSALISVWYFGSRART
jgi:hypothetical protein